MKNFTCNVCCNISNDGVSYLRNTFCKDCLNKLLTEDVCSEFYMESVQAIKQTLFSSED